MQNVNNRFILTAAVCGLTAFIGDFLITFILGFFYPGYNHYEYVMSELGSLQSPVAAWTGTWWVIFGILLIIFAIGYGAAFSIRKKSVLIIVLLIFFFGLGAGLGAGIFPMDSAGSESTLAGELHNAFAGAGFFAIAFVPLVSLAVFDRKQKPGLKWLSIGVFVLGLIFFVLFVVSEDMQTKKALLSYTGLWQRLFLLTIYLYTGGFAIKMICMSRKNMNR